MESLNRVIRSSVGLRKLLNAIIILSVVAVPRAQPFSKHPDVSKHQHDRTNTADVTNPEDVRPSLDDVLVQGQRIVHQKRPVPDNRGVRIAVDVGLELPAGRVWVAGADELGLEALELLLVA